LGGFDALIVKMIDGFNDFLRPEFCKIEVLGQDKYDVLLADDFK